NGARSRRAGRRPDDRAYAERQLLPQRSPLTESGATYAGLHDPGRHEGPQRSPLTESGATTVVRDLPATTRRLPQRSPLTESGATAVVRDLPATTRRLPQRSPLTESGATTHGTTDDPTR